MDTILVVVTGLSLAMAAGMGVLLVRMLSRERRRSDARVRLLEQLAAEPRPAIQPRVQRAPRVQPQAPMLDTVSQGQTTSRPPTPPRVQAQVSFDDLDLRTSHASTVVDQKLFHAHEAPSAWPRRVAVAGAVAAVLAIGIIGWSAKRPAAPGAGAAAVRAVAVDEPLELLSLQHTQQDGTLVISGLVQNPRSGAPRPRVHATVVLFGAGGDLLASARAPLDFTTLSPGAESPFVIRVPVATAVSRYRVGFRGEDDGVIGHVDRRNPDALARKQAP